MAELTREIVHDRKGASGIIAWLALILAIVALVLAWLAYNRSGVDLENRIQTQVNKAFNEVRQETRETGDELRNEADNVPDIGNDSQSEDQPNNSGQ